MARRSATERLNRRNDEERREWVQNDEGLYRWQLSSRQGLYRFVRENRKEIDELIDRQLNRKPQ